MVSLVPSAAPTLWDLIEGVLITFAAGGCGGGDGVGEGENEAGSLEALLDAGVDPDPVLWTGGRGSPLVDPRRTAAGGTLVSIGVGVDRDRLLVPVRSPLCLSVKLGLDKEGFEPVVAPSK